MIDFINFTETYRCKIISFIIRLYSTFHLAQKVNFTDFQFENQSECTSDFLVLQNGGRYDSPHIGQYCNSPSIETVTSQSNKLRIVMSTDSKGTARGFRLEYTFSHLGMNCLCTAVLASALHLDLTLG